MDKNNFLSTIGSASSVLILLPVRPYFDQVASGLALYLALSKAKEVSITCPSQMTVEFNKLVGVNKIKKELGKKNLVIEFGNYDGKGIERVSADMVEGVFQLTVIPKKGVSAPREDQVKCSYAGNASDVVIAVGGINESHFPAFSSSELENSQIVHVGIKKPEFTSTKNVLSFVRDRSSVSELVSSFFDGVDNISTPSDADQGMLTMDADIATNLLSGIEESTKSFSSQNTGAGTFFVVSRLMNLGGKREGGKVNINDIPPGAIPQVPNKAGRKQNRFSAFKEKDRKNSSQITKPKDTPKDWLSKPKIYKGSSGGKKN